MLLRLVAYILKVLTHALVILPLTCLIAISCSPHQPALRRGIDPLPEFKADQKVENSFKTKTLDSKGFKIQKNALNKEFMLSTNFMTQVPTPMFNSLQARIVYFILRSERIFMLEASQGHRVGNEENIPQSLILAEFPILNQDSDGYWIDFNKGMSELILVSAMPEEEPSEDYELSSAPIRLSFLEETTLTQQKLSIRQIAQIEKTENQKRTLEPLEIRYTLSPYLPDSSFKPTPTPQFKQVGYFQAAPLFDVDGSTHSNVAKFHPDKPIQFAISANTPEEFRPVIKEALLYWNKILGENKIQVIQLNDSKINAPHSDFNIVQWAKWDEAGYAYADMDSDPRSGEILHAQIFIPSAFAEKKLANRLRILENLNEKPLESNPQKIKHKKLRFHLKGFKSHQICRRNIFNELSKSYLPLLAEAPTPEIFKTAAKNYLRESVAHEMGHILGLRHNFAGSLAADYDVTQREKLMKNFYDTGKIPENIVTTSTVMDYEKFEESVWSGAIIADPQSKPFLYDQLAIEYLYQQKEFPAQKPFYCTDEDLDHAFDCNQFDAGSNLIKYSYYNQELQIKSVPMMVFNKYVEETKIKKRPIKVLDVVLNTDSFISNLKIDRLRMLNPLLESAQWTRVRSPLSPAELANEESSQKIIKEKEQKLAMNSFKELGGFEKVLTPFKDDLAQNWISQFADILKNPHFISGNSWGEKYTFSDEELDVMKKNFSLFANDLQKKLILMDLQSLTGKNDEEDEITWAAFSLTEELETLIWKRFELYGKSKIDQKYITAKYKNDAQEDVEVQLPVYKYPFEIRKATLSPMLSEHKSADWGFKIVLASQLSINEDIALLKAEMTPAEKVSLNKEAIEWLATNELLLKIFE
jgi:hypothetical protein